jgi:putative exporter of polyketide antibiotics
VNGPLLRYLWRRHALPCCACALAPIGIGLVIGFAWPEYRAQAHAIGGLFKFAMNLMRSDLLAPDSASFFFQLPFVHPITVLAILLAVAVPTLSLPAAARGRGSLDLLLASGLTRRSLVVTTTCAALPFALLIACAPLLGTYAGAAVSHATGDLDFSKFVRVAFEALLLALFFTGLSQLLSVVCNDLFGAAWRLAAIVLWSLLSEVVGTIWRAGHLLKFCGPFGYYEPAQVLAGVGDYGRDCTILAGSALVFFFAALIAAERRRSA